MTHRACSGRSRTARLAGGALSFAACMQRVGLAALHPSVVTGQFRISTALPAQPLLPIDGRVAPPYKHNVDVHGSKCFLPPPATTEAKISCDFFFFWASRKHVRWPCVHYRILATASPSIGGDSAAILLTGFSANVWKSELQTVMSDTSAAQKTLCIARKKTGMNI